ncbi:MAG: alpha/beta hydrolase [Candidatus Zixiibacteriota bacterium]|nr:MAG: alpha/beta hydrolase [candidate division Zixibacteria bacterium]
MRSLRSRLFRSIVKYWMSPKFNTHATVQQQRKALEGFAKLSLVPAKTEVQTVSIGNMSAEWISVGDTLEGCAVLYLHGGAYNIGSLNTHREIAARISKASKMTTLLIDYRLAPEHAHPAAVEDVAAAYRWLLGNGYSPENVVIAGDSAGGGLAIAALVYLRDAGEQLPAAAVCLSAWTDLQGTGPSMTTHTHADPFLTPEWLEIMAKSYAVDNDRRSPLISPLYAELSQLPPLLIQVGGDEILLSDSTRLADRAREAGVDVTLDVWEGMWHVWHFFAGQMPEARQAMSEVGKFIYKHINRNEERASVIAPNNEARNV